MSESIEIRVPTLGESVTEAIIIRWTKNVGDFVKVDETLLELETDKITLEVPSPTSGILASVHAPKGSTVKVNTLLGLMHLSQENNHATLSEVPNSTSHSSHYENIDSQKTLFEKIAAPNQPFERVLSSATIPQEDNQSHPPSVKRILAENNINPDLIPHNGKEGRLTKEDVVNFLQNGSFVQEVPVSIRNDFNITPETREWISEMPLSSSLQLPNNDRLEKRTPMSSLRQRIAHRLKEAQNTAAILTTFNEVDMSAVMNLRNKYKDVFEKKHTIKLGFMSFFVQACVHALKEIPILNSQIDNQDIVHKNYYDIGVAVSAPQGLVVPVLRNADELDIAGIERSISELGQKAKENKLTMQDLSGGTFTISNGGIFGSLLSTPIINPPQSGILGMHKIQDRPIAINGKVEIRSMMYIALSYDHRLIDGREAVTFLSLIKECVENPARFLLDL